MRRPASAVLLCVPLIAATCPESTPPPPSGGLPVVATVLVPQDYGLHDTFVRDGLAFLCVWDSGVLIYDVGNGVAGGSPANPKRVSKIVTSGSGIGGAMAHNAWWFHNPNGQKKYLFVGQEGPGRVGASSSGNIHVVDVSNLSQPVEVASYAMTGAGTHNFWMDEAAGVLFAAYYNGGVVALDVSGTLSGDLASRELARIQPGDSTDTYTWGVMQAGGLVYAVDMLSGLWQLTFTGASFAIANGGFNVDDRFGSDLWVTDNYAYTGTWGGATRGGRFGNAVKIWDLPGGMVLTDSVIVAGVRTVSDVQVTADDSVLAISTEAGDSAGVHLYGLKDPEHPVKRAALYVSQGVHTATVAEIGGRRYVFAARNPPSPALLIIDITNVRP